MSLFKRPEQFSKKISPSEFVANGIDQDERTRRTEAMQRYPEFALFGDFLTSERRINPDVIRQMSSNANVHGEYNLSMHENLLKGQDFNDWENMTPQEVSDMEQSLADTNMFRWILKGFYLHCKENNIKLPPTLDIFQKGRGISLQDIAEFIELVY